MSRRGRPLLSWQLGCSVPTGGRGVAGECLSDGRVACEARGGGAAFADSWDPRMGVRHTGGPLASCVVVHVPGDPGGGGWRRGTMKPTREGP